MDNRKLPDNHNVLESNKTQTHNILEQDFINYISIPSLEDIAIVNLVITLWKQPDLRDAMQQHSFKFNSSRGGYSYDDRDNSFNQIEGKILEKLSLLSLPELLKAKVAHNIRPVGLQILKWIEYNKDYLYFHNSIECIDSIQWTMEGTIDKAETLKLQLGNKNLEEYSIVKAFNIACENCLEDDVTNLWGKMPQEIKKELYNEDKHNTYKDHLVLYWSSTFENKLSRLLNIIKPSDYYNVYDCNHSVYKNMFAFSVSKGNTLAVKYFWHKLTEEEININIVKWTEDVIQKSKDSRKYSDYQNTNEYINILCFLLSKINDKEQQREIFKKYSDLILKGLFSYWPWQKFLFSTIRVMWDYLDEKVYVDLLSAVIREINGRSSSPEKLLKELWYDSPINFKKCFIQYIISDCYGKTLLLKLLKVEDIEDFELILNAANVEEKKGIIFSIISNRELPELIYADKLPLLDKLIGETLSLEYEIHNLKEKVVLKHGDLLCRKWICNDNWQAVETFFDWGFVSQDQVDNFKKCKVNKMDIAISLLTLGNYELVDKFMHWCFSSEEEVNKFKKEVAYSYGIVERLSYREWDLFKKFVDWCFNSNEDINQFKLCISQHDNMASIIFHTIVYGYNFEFATELLKWCLDSNEEIRQFKKKLILSETGIDMFERFVTNYKVYDSKYSNWELVKKLTQWYYPLEEEVINAFKEEVKNIKETFFGPEKCAPFYSSTGKKQALFRLLDSFSRDDNVSGNKSNSNDGFSRDDNISDNKSNSGDDSNSSDDSEDLCSLNRDASHILSGLIEVDND